MSLNAVPNDTDNRYTITVLCDTLMLLNPRFVYKYRQKKRSYDNGVMFNTCEQEHRACNHFIGRTTSYFILGYKTGQEYDILIK